MKAFLPNLRSSLATARRTAANSLALICSHARKPPYFCAYLLSTLLGKSAFIFIVIDEVITNEVSMCIQVLYARFCLSRNIYSHDM